MKRLALVLALLQVAGGVVAADEPPPWMPAPPPPPAATLERHVRKLVHEASIFGGVGLGLMAAGIAVDVVALDLPQGERSVPVGDGTIATERFRSDANWAEFGLGCALFAIGFGLSVAALLRLQQARRLSR